MNPLFIHNIFSTSAQSFDQLAFEVFHYQYANNAVYKQWADQFLTSKFSSLTEIPFLPISLFKTRKIMVDGLESEQVFTSSGTTGVTTSQHYVHSVAVYKNSFVQTFEAFYGSIKEWCMIGLLPSYLERTGSSLIFMVEELIQQSNHSLSGFYLNEFDKLANTLQQLEKAQQKTMLIGVTYALLDFAEKFRLPLKHTIVMETGGMKGRKKELTRTEIHGFLKEQFGLAHIHSEYGMTELLSQAYATSNGRYQCPPWMKVMVRNEEDPLEVSTTGRGVLNIIDLANVYSCAFIATDDLGVVYEDGSFEVLGRLDNSDIRGCSLLFI